MTVPESGPRPASYATRDEAVAYVGRLADGGPLPGAPVYLIASPSARADGSWPGRMRSLALLLPGVPLAAWDDLPGPVRELPGPAERAAAIAAMHRGAVVVPNRAAPKRRLIGSAAQGEARMFAALGRPVVVLTGRRLAAWPDVRRRLASPRPPGTPIELDVPGVPPSPLPTLAASLGAWGLGAEAIARASVGLPERRPAPRPGDGPG
jgi:hypothetical protein